jgi:hypothetical protein
MVKCKRWRLLSRAAIHLGGRARFLSGNGWAVLRPCFTLRVLPRNSKAEAPKIAAATPAK